MRQIAQFKDKYDVMIIGRGGGSLEDLWPFNEESVVRQVFDMKMPVISSVGHETDTTLCDLVADVRAATPTAAAEYATPNLPDELVNIRQIQNSLVSSMQNIIRARRDVLNRIDNSVIMREPARLYDEQAQTLDLLRDRLHNDMVRQLERKRQNYQLAKQSLVTVSPNKKIKYFLQQTDFYDQRLVANTEHFLQAKRNALGQAEQQLNDYDPDRILRRGYAYVKDQKNKTVNSVSQIAVKDEISIKFKDGIATAVISSIRREKNGDKEK